MATVVHQALPFGTDPEAKVSLTPDPDLNEQPFFVDGCHSWRAEGPVVAHFYPIQSQARLSTFSGWLDRSWRRCDERAHAMNENGPVILHRGDTVAPALGVKETGPRSGPFLGRIQNVAKT